MPVSDIKSEDNTETRVMMTHTEALTDVEKDRVKFTVHTRTGLPEFQKPEFSVIRHVIFMIVKPQQL